MQLFCLKLLVHGITKRNESYFLLSCRIQRLTSQETSCPKNELQQQKKQSTSTLHTAEPSCSSKHKATTSRRLCWCILLASNAFYFNEILRWLTICSDCGESHKIDHLTVFRLFCCYYQLTLSHTDWLMSTCRHSCSNKSLSRQLKPNYFLNQFVTKKLLSQIGSQSQTLVQALWYIWRASVKIWLCDPICDWIYDWFSM